MRRKTLGRFIATLLFGGLAGVVSAGEPVPVVMSLADFGLHIHRADRGTPWPAIRFGSWRLWDAGVQWTQLEPERGKWDFSRLDKDVDLAQQHQTALVLPLGLSPRWASARPDEASAYGEGRAAEPASMEDWRDYVRTVVTRYKGRVQAYEIWNEPNDKQFFSGTPEKLVELTCEAYRIVKQVDPAAILAGPAYTGEQNVDKFEHFLAIGGKRCMDVATYHLYVALSPPEAIPPLLDNLRAAMRRQGVGAMPLWNTETGWRIENADGSPEKGVPDFWRRVRTDESADFVGRALLLSSAYGASRFYWYSWDHHTLGLVEPRAGTLKPGAVAFGVVAGWLAGNPPPSCKAEKSVWTCELGPVSDQRTLVVWSEDVPRRFDVPAGWRVAALENALGVKLKPATEPVVRAEGLPKRLTLVKVERSDAR